MRERKTRIAGLIGRDKQNRPGLVVRGRPAEVSKTLQDLIRTHGGETTVAELVRRHERARRN